jgi:carbonic anhydrase/acetyltransferase-like protein (isoleucine patch superfamily)
VTIESNAAGDFPRIARGAYVHPSAVLIGRVIVEERTFIGPQAVLRADEPGADGVVQPVVVCAEANVQDAVVIHALGGTGVTIGPRASIAHGAVIHGPCEIAARCFVGFKSVVFRAILGTDVIVMHQALVEGVSVPAGLLVPSSLAVVSEEDVQRLAPAPADAIAFAQRVQRTNVFLSQAATAAKGANGIYHPNVTPANGPW